MQLGVPAKFSAQKRFLSSNAKKKTVSPSQQVRPGRRYKMHQHRMNMKPREYGSMRGKRNALKRECEQLKQDIAGLSQSLKQTEATTVNEAQRLNDSTKQLLPRYKRLEQVHAMLLHIFVKCSTQFLCVRI